MPNKIKCNFERFVVIANRRSRETNWRDIQGHIPPMIHEWFQTHSGFSDDLGPHMDRVTCALPFGKRQRRPVRRVAIHFSTLHPSATHMTAPRDIRKWLTG